MMACMKVADGIDKVDGIRVANAYLVTIPDGLMLVDSGMPGSAKRILASVERQAAPPRQLRSVVLTHCDIDHAGSAAELKRLTGAQVAIHALDAPVLSGKQQPQKGGRAMRLLSRLFRLQPVTPDVLLQDGDTIGGFRVLHVPGHTAGSIALYRDDGVVFSGDALLSDMHGRVLPPNPRLSLDPAQASASADKIRALGITVLLPGHGARASL
jgi:glyoxylase-like metal-dependent hydrolase (beta-lactamase superfamily II)